MAKSVGNFWRLHLPILLLRLPMLFELYKFAEVGESEFLDFFLVLVVILLKFRINW